ncbi:MULTISPECIES: 6-phosphogluconolactonase [Acidiphilium]|jgi:6-phosphogluconolactonase|uniref:6-phosphogluconolactonase n=1 Tax=Acidiphilium multivorum (strain DSM 11245 / JCM 8867 / NBRC 100883 / AIU 301) TaxID=926570 RepID=F0IY00_ACIMA|nr:MULTISPECIES: 6-phosphogluconolactonase [Acidiphilium]MBU6357305.1 6-phosphogluconolactonase [Rhodospirillales bacterium]KDM66648.1 6-phosphogluconolactonase Pgl [Acidiphilium sp. JA12-A1]MBS3024490.1 6-phosphogluconolactonase [Acidiphilium multivorum]MDE2326719.1 6-phosphogluconolactonase [Rhodospirillales bacterium]BAJ80660.1 6-phosphogluconolactonase [Acidiphilium multivorum AIU301]
MKPVRGELVVVPDAKAFAEYGARLFAEEAAAARGRFVAGLAGGSTPRALYERLAAAPWRDSIDWTRIDLVLGDERFVAPDDDKSNVRMIRDALTAHLPAAPRLHQVPFDGMTVDQAAAAYQRDLAEVHGAATLDPSRPFFDLCLLGMGDDGHTASLLPGQDDLLGERQRWVIPVTKGRPEARVTLTYPILESARVVVFLVSGAGKRDMLDRVLSGSDRDVPAARLRPVGRLIWLADRDAAGRWAD